MCPIVLKRAFHTTTNKPHTCTPVQNQGICQTVKMKMNMLCLTAS